MAEEVTAGDWERNYREKHLLFLWQRQGGRSLSERARHTDLLSLLTRCPIHSLTFNYYFVKQGRMGTMMHDDAC